MLFVSTIESYGSWGCSDIIFLTSDINGDLDGWKGGDTIFSRGKNSNKNQTLFDLELGKGIFIYSSGATRLKSLLQDLQIFWEW